MNVPFRTVFSLVCALILTLAIADYSVAGSEIERPTLGIHPFDRPDADRGLPLGNRSVTLGRSNNVAEVRSEEKVTLAERLFMKTSPVNLPNSIVRIESGELGAGPSLDYSGNGSFGVFLLYLLAAVGLLVVLLMIVN